MCVTLREGFALGTFASYVVDKKTGDVVLRMRADALHSENIARDARCSLYVQPATQPPGVLSRATLIGGGGGERQGQGQGLGQEMGRGLGPGRG